MTSFLGRQLTVTPSGTPKLLWHCKRVAFVMVTFLSALVAAARSALRSMLEELSSPDADEDAMPARSCMPKMLACLPSTGFQVAAFWPMMENAIIVPCECGTAQGQQRSL